MVSHKSILQPKCARIILTLVTMHWFNSFISYLSVHLQTGVHCKNVWNGPQNSDLPGNNSLFQSTSNGHWTICKLDIVALSSFSSTSMPALTHSSSDVLPALHISSCHFKASTSMKCLTTSIKLPQCKWQLTYRKLDHLWPSCSLSFLLLPCWEQL